MTSSPASAARPDEDDKSATGKEIEKRVLFSLAAALFIGPDSNESGLLV